MFTHSVKLVRPVRLLIASALGLWLLSGKAAIAEVTVDVLLSSDASPYLETLEGVRAQLATDTQNITLRVRDAGNDDHSANGSIADLDDGRASGILCVGTLACRAAQSKPSMGKPIVAALIRGENDIVDNTNTTAIFLEYLPETQLSELKRLFPTYRRVGLLYDANSGESDVAIARHAAESLGLTLVAVGIDSPHELPGALRRLLRQIDIFWASPDPRVLTPKSAREVMLATFRARIPVLGASASWVKSGALLAFDRDYHDIGRQSAERLQSLFSGALISELPPAEPRLTTYSINRRTAGHVRATIPQHLLAGAREIFDR